MRALLWARSQAARLERQVLVINILRRDFQEAIGSSRIFFIWDVLA